MNTISQDMHFRLSLIKYSNKFGVTKAAIRYKTTRQYIYFWLNRFDGSIESLRTKSRRPHSHPNQHSDEEIKLILDMRKRNPCDGLVVFWVKLRRRGYSRSLSSLFRVMRRFGFFDKSSLKIKYKPKPYKQLSFPGERIQIDTKQVPYECLVGFPSGTKLYQYTAIDEFSRLRYLEIFEEKSTYSSAQFILNTIDYFNFAIKSIRTDNGAEFTSKLCKNAPLTLFEQTLINLNIHYSTIRPYTPRHNGKVERSHRKDMERFYNIRSFHSINDIRNQLKRYLREYNNFPMAPLDWKSPIEYLENYYINLS